MVDVVELGDLDTDGGDGRAFGKTSVLGNIVARALRMRLAQAPPFSRCVVMHMAGG